MAAALHPSEKFQNQRGSPQNTVVVKLSDNKLIKGHLLALDHRDKFFRVRPIEDGGNKKILEFSFEDTHSIYFVQELTLAFSDPTDLDPKQELSFYTGKQIKEVIATEKGISEAIDVHYGQGPDADDYLEKFLADEAQIEAVEEKSWEEYEISKATGLEKPIIKMVNHILKTAVVKKASDLHIVPEGKRVKVELRIDGELHEELSLNSERLPSVIARMKIIGNMNIAERRLPQDGRAKVKVGNKIISSLAPCTPITQRNRLSAFLRWAWSPISFPGVS